MAQQVQQNQLSAQVATRGQNLGLVEANNALGAQQTSSLIGAGGAAVGAGLMLMSDEMQKTDVSGQGNGSPGSSASAGSAAVGGLSKDQIKNALNYFRTSWQQAWQPPGQAAGQSQVTSQGPQMQPQAGMGPMSDERLKSGIQPAPTADA